MEDSHCDIVWDNLTQEESLGTAFQFPFFCVCVAGLDYEGTTGDGGKTELHYSFLLSIVLPPLSINAHSSGIHQGPLSKCYHRENAAACFSLASKVPSLRIRLEGIVGVRYPLCSLREGSGRDPSQRTSPLTSGSLFKDFCLFVGVFDLN